MKTLNIEVAGKKVVRLQERRDKSVEVVVSRLVQTEYREQNGVQHRSGVYDTVIATIPTNRREIVANFLLAL